MKPLPPELENAPSYDLDLIAFFCHCRRVSVDEFVKELLGDQSIEQVLSSYQKTFGCDHEEAVEIMRKNISLTVESGLEEIYGKRQ